MAPPNGYYDGLGWWFSVEAPDPPSQSVFPNKDGGPGWYLGKIPKKHCSSDHDSQGWKIHVCVQPGEIEGLFLALKPALKNYAHKFAPFEIYKTQSTSHKAYQLIGTKKKKDDPIGKACVIYPKSPTEIAQLVPILERNIAAMGRLVSRHIDGKDPQQLRPFPGGVKGDLALGTMGFIYTRYGGFTGKLAEDFKLYDPISDDTCDDPRFIKPYPDFIKAIPDEIAGVLRK